MQVIQRQKNEKPEKCYFCESRSTPHYFEVEVLRKFLTPRGKILAAMKTGICAKHQRALSNQIKISRQLALL